MMYSLVNGRNQRHKTQMYNPMNHSYANYCVEALQKSEMKIDYENEIFLNNLHLIPDPLKKNLADTLITAEKPEKLKKSSLESPKMPPQEEVRHDSALAGITNFFSGVISMLSGAMFRSRSPVNYDDCFDANSRQGSPSAWRRANIDEDKNGQAVDRLSSDATSPNVFLSDMNNCKTVHTCEEKLNQVRYLLTPKPVNKSNPIWLRKRPKKVFVEPGSVEDSFEDAFSPEDFVTLSNDPYIEYYSPPQYQSEEMCATEAPKTKIEVRPITETTNIVKDITENETGKLNVEKDDKNPESDKLENDNNTKEDSVDNKHQLVSSCEDKLSKLKALLQDKRKKHTEVDPTPEPTTEQPRPAKTIPINKPKDKHYKNPHRMLDKRQKMKMNRSIQDDVIFANEIDIESTDNSPTVNSSSDTSLGDYFDEMKGRFRSISNTESEDSFQIVFNDSPKLYRKASDCESEDSFIVFEDNDNCYTSNEVFGDSDCDSDSDVSDSGCSTMTCKLSHSLSRTVSNLTDDTLYESSDEVDCGRVEPVVEAKGLLMDTYKKSLRKDQPSKKVTFSTEPPTVRVMRVWAFAARQARAGHWERFALDRDRFKRRIADVDMAVSWVLKPQHRSRVMFQRFMPWWNREKRRELAEKKERQEKQKQEEEEKRIEEEMRQDEDKRKEKGEKTQAELENTEKEDIKDATKFDGSETKMSDDNISKTAIKATGIVNEKKNDERDIERNNNKMLNNDDNSKIVKINKNPNTKTGADSKLKQPKGVSVKKRSDSVTDRRTGKLK